MDRWTNFLSRKSRSADHGSDRVMHSGPVPEPHADIPSRLPESPNDPEPVNATPHHTVNRLRDQEMSGAVEMQHKSDSNVTHQQENTRNPEQADKRRAAEVQPENKSENRSSRDKEDDEDNDDDTRYPVHKLLNHRVDDENEVALLVQWGGEWLDHEPTWLPEDELWETCRAMVNRYWSPRDRNQRNRMLGLDPVNGPFTVHRILGEKTVRMRGRKAKETCYLTEFVGYAQPEWQLADCLPAAMVRDWKKASLKPVKEKSRVL
ncbi:hypothetical protein EsH8_V_001064 [Colletotrichum jinshuiense]